MADAARRTDWWKVAIVAAIAIEVAGSASGWLSNSGFGNPWFDALRKPSFMPPGVAFGIVWPILYALMGISLALILVEPDSKRRRIGLNLFFAQLGLNFAWSPIFFALHDIRLAKVVIYVMAALAAAAVFEFLRVRRAAGLLLMPYVAWLLFAATLNTVIEQLNPTAGVSVG